MRRPVLSLLLLAGLLAGLVAAAPASSADARTPLRAGIASVDITPALGGEMLGYVRPDIPTDGVHTRLTGRALVLDDGSGQPVALLATDLGFALRKDAVVARVADLGYTNATVVYHSSHTHAGPDELSDWQVDQLARAIRTAHEARVPVRAAWGTSERQDINRNRSIEAHLANHGMDLFYGQGHHDDDPHGVEHTRDTTVRVLRIDRADGSGPLTAWTHFPVHLTTVTPANSLWDADLAGTATHHLEEAVGAPGFTAAYANGAQGDLMPRFDSYNPQALVDLHGRRLAAAALEAWKAAGPHLTTDVPVQIAWTKACYCGQEVDDEGHAVSDTPVWGLPFLGGSEDGASIFHEPVQTEGRRLPAALAHPVHGRKIVAAPTEPIGVHDTEPEFAAVRLGDRVLLASPGEPSVEMGRRFVAAVRAVLPSGVTDAFNLGLANGYLGYLVTPEEYDMQHYEGGHTVYGKWTSLLAQLELRAAVERLAAGEETAPSDGGEAPALTDPAVGDGGVAGAIVSQPEAAYQRMDVVRFAWTGAAGGVDRPAGTPFVQLQRRAGETWVTEDSDLGVAMVWRQEGDRYEVRIDLRRDLPVGDHRVLVTSGSYTLASEAFTVGRSTGVRLRGAELVRRADGRAWIRIVAQNPPPDPATAVLWRPIPSAGGTVVVEKGDERRIAHWDAALRGWVVPDWQPGCPDPGEACPAIGYHVVVPAGGLRDGVGNTNGDDVMLDLTAGFAPADWPDSIGVGGGRTPGPGGEGSFPP